jgi:hypothetical protein
MEYGRFTCIGVSSLVGRRVSNTLLPTLVSIPLCAVGLFQISQVITKYNRFAKKRAKETFRHFKLAFTKLVTSHRLRI